MRTIIKAITSFLTDDSTKYPTAQVSSNGEAWNAQRMGVYGVSSHPPLDSLALVLSPSGRVDDTLALIDDVVGRFKPLAEGEVQIGNYLTRSNVLFAEDGSIIISVVDGGNYRLTLDNGELNVEVNGGGFTLTSSGNVDVSTQGNMTGSAQGNVTVTAGGVAQVQAPTIQVIGDVTVTGNLTVSGIVTGTTDVVGGALGVSLSTHTHGISAGSSAGTTTPPT